MAMTSSPLTGMRSSSWPAASFRLVSAAMRMGAMTSWTTTHVTIAMSTMRVRPPTTIVPCTNVRVCWTSDRS